MAAVVLNYPESMAKFRVITLKDYSELALKTLHKVGVLHVEEGKELKPIDKAAVESQLKEVDELLAFVGNMLGYITEKQKVSTGEDVEVIYTRPFGEISREVRSLYNKFAELDDKTVKIDKDIRELAGQKRYLEPLTEQHDLRLKDLEFSGDYLFSRVFILASEAYETLREQVEKHLFGGTIATIGNETVLYAIGKVENQEAIESLITGAGGSVLQIPDGDLTQKKFLEKAEDKLHKLEEKLTKIYEELQSKAKQELKRIVLLQAVLVAERQRLSVLARACEAKYVILIEGWIPEKNIESVVFELKESVDHVFIDTREPEPSEEPPTKWKNPALFRPFQVVVYLFGTPRYREWDPTPIIAYSFAFFFGLMVADVVYAAGLILLGRFLVPRFFGSESEHVKLLQKVTYICGTVGIVIGLLSGSYLGNVYTLFGFESLGLVAVVQQALQNPLTFIILALGIGFIHVNIGHVIALVKGIKERNKGAIINKAGLFTLQLGIPFILRTMLNVSLPLFSPQFYAISMYFILIGIILIVVGTVVERGGMGAILWLFDLTGLLGDIMSYARLAGVGLATYYLAVVFNMLAPLFGGLIPISGVAGVVGGAILTVVILVLGHALNLVLSALTGFIHSLRLCFVEFLFKFYEGGGIEYSPFRLRKRPPLLVGAKS